MLLLALDVVNVKFIKVSWLIYLMFIRWAVCVWLQCDSVLCEFNATFNLLAIVIITIFIINFGSIGCSIPAIFSSTVKNSFIFPWKLF